MSLPITAIKSSMSSSASLPRATTLCVPADCRCDGYEHSQPTGVYMSATILTVEDAARQSGESDGQISRSRTRFVEDIAHALFMLQHRPTADTSVSSPPAFRFMNKEGQEVGTFRTDCDLRAMALNDGGRRERHTERLPDSPLTVLQAMTLYPQWCLRVLDTHSVVAGTMVNDAFVPSDWQAFDMGGVRDDRMTAYRTWREGFLTWTQEKV